MKICADSSTVEQPAIQPEDGGAIPTSALHISPCPLSEVREFIEANHYSRSVNGVKITQCFSVRASENLVGGVIFGQLSTTAWKKFGAFESEVLELRRLVLVNEAEKNSESFVVGFVLRWIKKNLQKVKVIVSYADPHHGHSGIIYRATNFQYVGKTPDDTGFEDLETGKVYHSRALRTKYKGDYKPFAKRLRAKLSAGQLREISLPGKLCFTYKLR